MTPRRRLLAELASNRTQIVGLELDHSRILAASESSNADDEHDPEGATVAFERQQVMAVLDQARRTQAQIEQALDRLDRGVYGTCERCGRPISAERLDARPSTSTCICCAT